MNKKQARMLTFMAAMTAVLIGAPKVLASAGDQTWKTIQKA